METVFPAPGDIQVATAWPEVNAYRDACFRLMDLHARVRSAVDYEAWALDTYVTTTETGRAHRAQASRAVEEARQAVARLEERLPALEAAAEKVAPAAAERARLSPLVRSQNLALQYEERL